MDRQWSSEQKAIFGWFEHGDGNLVVRARAGCGKTTTLIEAINFAPERRILLAAFNKIIAEELQARLRNPQAEAKTLHGLGYSYVRKNLPKIKVDNRRKWALADAACGKGHPQAVLRLVADLHTKCREIAPRLAKLPPAEAVRHIEEIALVHELTLSTDNEETEKYTDEQIAVFAHDALRAALLPPDSIDFADMIFLPLVHGWVSPRYDLVCIDEAQDMSQPQIELAERACIRGGRIAVIGDDKQAVYGWRGADSDSLDRLKCTLHATELGLKTTYRCPKAVVAKAAEIVPDFIAAATAPDGIVRECSDAKDTLVRDAAPGDFVLSRTNAPLVPLCLQLLKAGKLARVRGRDLSAGLRKLCESLQRRGATDLDGLREGLFDYVSRETAALERRVERGELVPDAIEPAIERLHDNRDVIFALCDGLSTFAELYARFDTLFVEDGRETVMFSTVHRAKGLEADRVWLLTKTFLRSRRDAGNDSDEPASATKWRKGKEEANIRYVAITRAKRELVWLNGELE